MSITEIKDLFKSLTKFWFLSPVAILETCQEQQDEPEEDATTDLSIHRHYYKK